MNVSFTIYWEQSSMDVKIPLTVSDGKRSNHQVWVLKDAALHWIIILEKDWQEVCGPVCLLSKHNHTLCLAARSAVLSPVIQHPGLSASQVEQDFLIESSHSFADCPRPVCPVGCYHPPTANAYSVTWFGLIALHSPPVPISCPFHSWLGSLLSTVLMHLGQRN